MKEEVYPLHFLYFSRSFRFVPPRWDLHILTYSFATTWSWLSSPSPCSSLKALEILFLDTVVASSEYNKAPPPPSLGSIYSHHGSIATTLDPHPLTSSKDPVDYIVDPASLASDLGLASFLATLFAPVLLESL